MEEPGLKAGLTDSQSSFVHTRYVAWLTHGPGTEPSSPSKTPHSSP